MSSLYLFPSFPFWSVIYVAEFFKNPDILYSTAPPQECPDFIQVVFFLHSSVGTTHLWGCTTITVTTCLPAHTDTVSTDSTEVMWPPVMWPTALWRGEERDPIPGRFCMGARQTARHNGGLWAPRIEEYPCALITGEENLKMHERNWWQRHEDG